MKEDLRRCGWCLSDPLYIEYHDTEWGTPLHGEIPLFELLILEGMQAGLSWLTILKKRDAFRKAFLHFAPEKVASFNAADIDRLMQNPAILRNRKKLEATVRNARALLDMRESLDSFVWNFVEGKPIENRWEKIEEVPCVSPLSEAMAKELKARGFSFVGPKICYSFMQAAGLVNDHITSCYRRSAL